MWTGMTHQAKFESRCSILLGLNPKGYKHTCWDKNLNLFELRWIGSTTTNNITSSVRSSHIHVCLLCKWFVASSMNSWMMAHHTLQIWNTSGIWIWTSLSLPSGYYGERGRRGGYMEITDFNSEIKKQVYKVAYLRSCIHTYSSISGQILVGLVWTHQRSVLYYLYTIRSLLSQVGDESYTSFQVEKRMGYSIIILSLCRGYLSIFSIPLLNFLLYSSNKKCSTDICIMFFFSNDFRRPWCSHSLPLRAICSRPKEHICIPLCCVCLPKREIAA